ncbi:putative reverse transcriptase domain-containing protein [Tanacetum coccineum]
MENLPPPNNDPNILEDEHAPAPEHAPIAPNHAPIQPNDYLANDEADPEEEEEPIPEQAPAAHIEEDDEDEVEAEEEDEEEIKDEEDEEMEVEDNDGENDDVEVYNPYEEADPLNRPPPRPKTAEREIMNVPVTRIYPPGPMENDLNALCSRVKTLSKQIWDRFRVESSSSRMLEKNDMRMDSFDDDLTALDSTFREQMQEMKKAAKERAEYNHMEAEYYKNHWARVSWYYDDLSGWEYRLRNQLPLKRRYRETPYDPSTNPASRPRHVDPYVMVRDNAVRADAAGDHGGKSVDTTAIVKDAGEEKDDEGDAAAAKDSQPLESRGSPRDPVREEATRAGGSARGPAAMPVAREYTFAGFIKCGPTQFHGTEGAVGLCHWFEKMESTFGISECAERRKVKFATATLHGRALTWWNSQVATLGLEVANGKSWSEVKQKMLDEFCPTEEVQRLEEELRDLKLRDMNIAAYTERYNELALLCPDAVPNEKKKVELYIKGLPEIIKGETTSSRPTTLNEAENNNQGRNNKRNNNDNRNNYNNRNNRSNYRDNNHHNQYNQRRQDGAKAMTAAQNNVVDQGGPAPKCNSYGLCHFGNCPAKCTRCNKRGHKLRDCKARGMTTGVNALPIQACYECRDRNHERSRCPKLAN